MQGPKFLFALLNKIGQSASYVNNALIWNSAFTPLRYAPDTWQELSILTERNKNSFGLDITYGPPGNFVKTAAGILKSIAYLKGIEETVYLQILEQQLWFNDTEYGFYYKELTKTEIDLGSFIDTGVVSAAIMDGDMTKYLRANEAIEYAIDLDVPDRQPILFDGVTLKQNAQFVIQTPLDILFTGAGNHILGLSLTSIEQKQTIGAKTSTYIVEDRPTEIPKTGDYILKTSGITQLTIITDFALTIQPFPGSGLPVLPTLRYFFNLNVYDAANNLVPMDPIFDSGPGFESAIGRHIVKVTKTLTIPSDCTVYPFSHVNVTNASYAGGLQFTYDNDSQDGPGSPHVLLQYDYRPAQQKIYGFTLKQVLEKLMEKMTDGQYTATSDLLNNPDLNVMLTCGDALRRLLGAQIKISMKKFLTIVNLVHGVGWGKVGNQFKIERKRYWVAPDDPGVALNISGTFKCRPATDLMFSAIKVGWPNQNYSSDLGDINGKYEVCTTSIYTTPVTRVSMVLDITTTARADMHGATFTFINLEGKSSVSDNADNDVFCLHVEDRITEIPSPITGEIILRIWKLDRTVNSKVVDNNILVKKGQTYMGNIAQQTQYVQVGLLDKASAFNVRLSPKQCLLRAHGDYIHSCLDRMETKYLTFSRADKNSALIIDDPGGVSSEENGNVQISTLAPKIFQPWIFEGTIANPENLGILIAGNPVRKYNTSYQDIPISGTAQKSAIAPDTNATQEYQLLIDPFTDVTKFIDVYE